MAQQRSAEGAADREVDVLLNAHDARVRACGALCPRGRHGGSVRKLRLAQEAQLCGGGTACEFGEIDGRVVRLELLVEEVRGGLRLQDHRFLHHRGDVGGCLGAAVLRYQVDEVVRARDALVGAQRLVVVIHHHVAHHAADVPPGKRVVADVRDAGRGEVARRDAQDGLLDLGGDPRVDPVTDDVVERAQVISDVRDAHRLERDVREAQLRDLLPAQCDLSRREVDANEGGPGIPVRHRDEVASGRATQLQDTRAVCGRCDDAVQERDRFHRADLTRADRPAVVGNGFVAVA